MTSQTDLDDDLDTGYSDDTHETDVLLRPSLGVRLLWATVFTLGGLLLLALLTVASAAVVAPQMFEDPCYRRELVTPAGCDSTASLGGFAGDR